MTQQRLIARHVLAKQLSVRPATLAKSEKHWLPAPVQRISDRLILYDLDAVERAIAERAARPRPDAQPATTVNTKPLRKLATGCP